MRNTPAETTELKTLHDASPIAKIDSDITPSAVYCRLSNRIHTVRINPLYASKESDRLKPFAIRMPYPTGVYAVTWFVTKIFVAAAHTPAQIKLSNNVPP